MNYNFESGSGDMHVEEPKYVAMAGEQSFQVNMPLLITYAILPFFCFYFYLLFLYLLSMLLMFSWVDVLRLRFGI